MNDEMIDETIAEYERIKADAQAGMRGAIATLGIDAAIDIAANRSDDLKELYTLSGILRAVFDAGRLAGVR
jgi:hypothetical protein